MIKVTGFAKKLVFVVGLGRSGLASAEALRASGAEVLIWDDNAETRSNGTAAGFPAVQPEMVNWRKLNALVLSPGIPHTHPEPHPAARLAKDSRTQIIGDIDVLARSVEGCRMVGISGTNGKSTTTALLGHILETCKVPSVTAGNIGTPVLALDQPAAGDTIVLELSSYQLETAPHLKCSHAALLNITPDHIDRHGDMDGYIAAKLRLFEQQEKGATAIISMDDENCRTIADNLKNRHIVRISGNDAVEGGVFARNGQLIDDRNGNGVEVMSVSDVATLPGMHNAQNAAASLALALGLGCEVEGIRKGISTFPGLAHRQELVGSANGITYINDSKATNAEAAAKALSCYDSIYWIAGGQAKEGGISSLEAFFPRIRHAWLIGESAETFGQTLDGKTSYSIAGELDRAVTEAHERAQSEKIKGGTVLLSPAAASFDQFRSFEARGDAYRDAVNDLIGRAVA